MCELSLFYSRFIIWELTGDVTPELETPLLDEVQMKLHYPNTHVCGGSPAKRENPRHENQFSAESIQEALAVIEGKEEW